MYPNYREIEPYIASKVSANGSLTLHIKENASSKAIREYVEKTANQQYSTNKFIVHTTIGENNAINKIIFLRTTTLAKVAAEQVQQPENNNVSHDECNSLLAISGINMNTEEDITALLKRIEQRQKEKDNNIKNGQSLAKL